MEAISSILPYIQVILGLLVIAGILLQQTDAAAGAFADTSGLTTHTRRGPERFIFTATIVCAVLFTAAAFLNIIV